MAKEKKEETNCEVLNWECSCGAMGKDVKVCITSYLRMHFSWVCPSCQANIHCVSTYEELMEFAPVGVAPRSESHMVLTADEAKKLREMPPITNKLM